MASRVSNQVNFAVIPEWVLFAAISANAVRLYGVLNRHADKDLKARPSRKRVADLMHVSPSTVDRGLDELVRIGAVTVKERYERASGSDERRQTSNWYILNAVPQGAAQLTIAEPSQTGDPLVTREQGGLSTGDEPPLVTREQGKNESPSELEPPTPAKEQQGQPQLDAIKTRFLGYVDQESAAPCWLWTGTTKSKGYGLFWVGGKNAAAHRWAYEAFVEPIPEGLQIHHECSNPGCVNPAHLKPVTNAENARQTKSERTPRTHCLKGHAFTSGTTYVHPDGQRRCRTCYNDWERRQYGNGGSKRTEGKNPRALGTNPRKVAEREAEERRQRQAGCQTCDGMGVVMVVDDGAIPCPDCREVKAS